MFLKLLNAAIATGKIRGDVDGNDILFAIASLCMSPYSEGQEHTLRMVSLLIDGLRYMPGIDSGSSRIDSGTPGIDSGSAAIDSGPSK